MQERGCAARELLDRAVAPTLSIVALGTAGPGRAPSHPCPGLLGGQMLGATV